MGSEVVSAIDIALSATRPPVPTDGGAAIFGDSDNSPLLQGRLWTRLGIAFQSTSTRDFWTRYASRCTTRGIKGDFLLTCRCWSAIHSVVRHVLRFLQ